MSTFDFSRFESTNNSESNFKEAFTIEEIKEAYHGAEFRVVPCKDSNKCFFACGRLRGYVAQATADKLKYNQNHPNAPQAIGTLVVSHVVSDTFDGLMLHEEAQNNHSIKAW